MTRSTSMSISGPSRPMRNGLKPGTNSTSSAQWPEILTEIAPTEKELLYTIVFDSGPALDFTALRPNGLAYRNKCTSRLGGSDVRRSLACSQHCFFRSQTNCCQARRFVRILNGLLRFVDHSILTSGCKLVTGATSTASRGSERIAKYRQ